MRVGCVLLASGFARRFGGNKLLTPVEGVPLVTRTFSALPAQLFFRAAVTSQYPEVLALGAAKGYLPLKNLGAEEGIAAGVRLGLEAMGDCDGVLFAVCDQPWLTRESVCRLLETFSRHPDRVVALSWAGARGNPVLFPADLFPELLALTGDRGGGAVLRRHPERLLLVEAGDPRELRDVDEPTDLDRG